jgi:hypothetical protein
MIVGNITTKDILAHPAAMVSSFGANRYFHFLLKALSPRTFRFLDLLFK